MGFRKTQETTASVDESVKPLVHCVKWMRDMRLWALVQEIFV